MILETGHVTNVGAQILARAHAEQKKILWTRCGISNTNHANSTEETFKNLTKLSCFIQGSVLSSLSEASSHSIKLSCELMNSASGSYARTFGVFGKVDGDEYDVLVYVTRAAGSASYINAQFEGILRILVDVVLSVDDFNQTSVTISPAGMATQSALAATNAAVETLQTQINNQAQNDSVVHVYNNFLEAQKYAKDGDIVSIRPGAYLSFDIDAAALQPNGCYANLGTISNNVLCFYVATTQDQCFYYIIRDLLGYITGEQTPEATPHKISPQVSFNTSYYGCLRKPCLLKERTLFYFGGDNARYFEINQFGEVDVFEEINSTTQHCVMTLSGLYKHEISNGSLTFYKVINHVDYEYSVKNLITLSAQDISSLFNVNCANIGNAFSVFIHEAIEVGFSTLINVTLRDSSQGINLQRKQLVISTFGNKTEITHIPGGFLPRANGIWKPCDYYENETVNAVTCDGFVFKKARTSGSSYDYVYKTPFGEQMTGLNMPISGVSVLSNSTTQNCVTHVELLDANLHRCRMYNGQLVPFMD